MGQQQKIGRGNTSVVVDDGWTKVQFHDTVVARWNGKFISRDSGGWRTATTKTRMNQASNQYDLGFCVWQKDFEWFVSYRGEVLEFSDGMVLERKWL